MTMSTTTRFDVATAALEYLELLNCSNQNPLEVAAQFRTLLRSKKAHVPNTDYTYADYISADATIRKRGRSCSLADKRSKCSGKIQYEFDKDQSSTDLSTCPNTISSTEDISPDSAVSSDSSEPKQTVNSNRLQYPKINWKQLRERQQKQKLEKVKQYLSTKIQTNHLARIKSNTSTSSSLTSVSNCTYQKSIFSPSSSSSSSTSIRTPSISPSDSPRITYTISRLNPTKLNPNNEDILLPIADCNLVIKHKMKRLSHFESSCDENELILW